ncbi:DMT family transporter [Thiolinea disciformis]|uniref:DMT family transporter n=1 Tax=Thiolinea disciformis TaxID=125614 RepID=UPI0003820812|nr:SMR family transporter [Thiolinea disciformis]
MHYFYLLLSIVFDVAGMAALHKAHGLSHVKYLIIGLVLFNLAIVAFALCLRQLDITTANATWAGLSILSVSLLGYLNFDEHFNGLRCFYIFLVTCGVVGLNVTSVSH